jgi:hypothetical protein
MLPARIRHLIVCPASAISWNDSAQRVFRLRQNFDRAWRECSSLTPPLEKDTLSSGDCGMKRIGNLMASAALCGALVLSGPAEAFRGGGFRGFGGGGWHGGFGGWRGGWGWGGNRWGWNGGWGWGGGWWPAYAGLGLGLGLAAAAATSPWGYGYPYYGYSYPYYGYGYGYPYYGYGYSYPYGYSSTAALAAAPLVTGRSVVVTRPFYGRHHYVRRARWLRRGYY